MNFFKVSKYLAIIFVVFSVLYLGWKIVSKKEFSSDFARKEQSGVPFRKTSRSFISHAKINNLFKKEQIETKPVIHVNAKPDFKLKGIASISKGNKYAVIEMSGGGQRLLREKEKVLNWTVKFIDIDKNEVVLTSRSNERFVLRSDQESERRVNSAKRFKDAELTQINDNNWQVGRKMLQEATGDFNSIIKDVRIIPHFSGGKASGYFLAKIKKGSLIDRAGFRNGDVVMKINDHSLSNFSEIVKIYDDLNSSKEINVLVKREGEIITRSYKISDE